MKDRNVYRELVQSRSHCDYENRTRCPEDFDSIRHRIVRH
jgi:hypothetical protein